jgi:hypothetical protein
MIRSTLLVLSAALALALVTTSAAFAGSLPAAGSGTVAVYVPGVTAGASVQPSYEGTIGFDVTGTGKLKNPLTWTACYQSGLLVYGAQRSPWETLRLGGDMSQWVLNGGGAASCTVQLYYILNAKGTAEWNGSGAQGGNVVLAQSAFEAAA